MNKKQITAFALGPVAGSALGLISLPVITWYYTAEDIGRIAMLQVVNSLVVMLFSLGLDQAYVREYHEAKNKRSLFKTSLVPGLSLLTIFLSACFLYPSWIAKTIFSVDSPGLSALVALYLLLAFVARFLSLILRLQERGLAFSMSQVLPKLIFVLVLGVFIFFSRNFTLLELVVAHTISFLMVVLVCAWNTKDELKPMLHETIDRRQLNSLLRFGMPLVFGGLTSWGIMVADKLFLRKFSSFEELGIYSVAVSFGAVAGIFQSVFSTIWAPTIYKWSAVGINDEEFDQVTEGVLATVVFIFALCGLFSWVICFILPIKYSQVQFLVVACLACPLFYTMSEITVVGIGVSRKSIFSMMASFFAACVSLVANYLLVPKFGAAGAAIASAIAFWFFFFFRTELAIKVWRPLPRKRLYGNTLLCLALAVSFAMFGAAHRTLFIFMWGVLLVVAGLIFRNSLKKLLKLIIALKENLKGRLQSIAT